MICHSCKWGSSLCGLGLFAQVDSIETLENRVLTEVPRTFGAGE